MDERAHVFLLCRFVKISNQKPTRFIGQQLEVPMNEDQSRARTGYAAENLATLRRLALNLLKREATKKRGIKGKQLNASWNHAYLLRLLGVPV